MQWKGKEIGLHQKWKSRRRCRGFLHFFKFLKMLFAKACQFNLSTFVTKGCGNDTDYGFKEGKPCIILSLNRLIGWVPKPFEDEAIPDVVRTRYDKESIAFYCNGTV
jgi:hypothetical protein